MFHTKENRYMTKGVDELAPKTLQYRCWQPIDQTVSKGEYKLDYLQILNLIKRTNASLLQSFIVNYHDVKNMGIQIEKTFPFTFLSIQMMRYTKSMQIYKNRQVNSVNVKL